MPCSLGLVEIHKRNPKVESVLLEQGSANIWRGYAGADAVKKKITAHAVAALEFRDSNGYQVADRIQK